MGRAYVLLSCYWKVPSYYGPGSCEERFIVLAYRGLNLPAEAAVNASANVFRTSEGIPLEIVRSEIEHICSSPDFQASARRRTFLQFIVEETLSGRAESLKGYTIALAVFGRDESFDSQADPVVRLEARRLRRDLDSYYMDAGQNAPVRIRIPKGSYVPSFEWRNEKLIARTPDTSESEALPAQDRKNENVESNGRPVVFRRSLIAAALGVGLAIGLAFWKSPFGTAPSPSGSSREPGVLVTPFEALSAGENARYLAMGMGQELTSNLFQFSGFRLYTSSATSSQHPQLMELARNLGASYVITGNVQTDVEEVRVTTSVVNATSGGIVWAKSYSRPFDPESLVLTQRSLADEIAEVIGQPYGVVKTDMSQRPLPPASSMDSYRCVLRGYGYRRTFLRSEFKPAVTCLEQAVERDPKYSDAWAMLGWLHLDAGRLSFIGDDQQKEYEKARTAISRAIELQPKNPLALKALAAAYYFTGRYDESERLTRQLVGLYPNDPEILAQLGWRLSVRGNFEEGVPALKRAIDRTLNPPNWYFHFIAVNYHLQGEYEEARRIAERASLGDSGFSQLILATSNAALGNREGTQQALEKLARYEPLARDTEGFLRRQGVAGPTVEALVAGLERARSLVSR